jgi:hypothetical protein
VTGRETVAGQPPLGNGGQGPPLGYLPIAVDLADDRDASLVVLGSHGRTGVADLLLGNVAGAVAAHSRRSVLITHPISHAVELGAERIYVLATDDPVTRAVPLPPRGALDAAVHAFTLLVGARLQADLARYATAAELIVLPAVNRERIQPTDFDHASRLIAHALTAARAVLDAAPVVESVAA